MRAIHKGAEPTSLANWKRKHPQDSYMDLDPEIRQAILHCRRTHPYFPLSPPPLCPRTPTRGCPYVVTRLNPNLPGRNGVL